MNSDSRTNVGSPAQYQVNFRLLAISLLVVAGIGLASFFWYRFASKKSAIGFLVQARSTYGKAEQMIGDPPQAAEGFSLLSQAFEQYWQYVQIQNDDIDALKEFAERYDQSDLPSKNYRRAVNLYQRVIAQSQPLPTYRARLAYNLVQIGEYGEAEKQALKVIEELGSESNGAVADDPSLATAWGALAWSLLGQFQLGLLSNPDEKSKQIGRELGDVLVHAVELNPNDWKLGFSVAGFWLDDQSHKFLSTKQKEEISRLGISKTAFAVELANQVRNRNDSNPDALGSSYLFKQLAAVANPEVDLKDALSLAPKNQTANALFGKYLLESVTTELAAGQQAELTADQRSMLERSRDCLVEAKSGSNQDIPVHVKLGQVFQLLGNAEEALATWKDGLGKDASGDFELLYRIVEFLVANDRLTEAEQELANWTQLIATKSLAKNPNPKLISLAQTHRSFWQARLQLKQNQIDEARSLFDFVLLNDSTDKYHSRMACLSLADWFENHDLPGEAARQYEAALALSPQDNGILLACARSQARAENWQRAKELMQSSLGNSNSPDLNLAYANVLLQVEANRSPGNRDWTELDRIVAQLDSGEAGTSPTKPELLERLHTAMMVVKNGGSNESSLAGLRAQLAQLEKNDSNSVDHVRQLAYVLANLGDNEKIEQLIQERVSRVVDVFDRTVLEVEIRSRRQSEGDLAAAQKLIQQVLPSLTDVEQQISLKLLMARTLVGQSDIDKALAMLVQLQSERIESSRVLMELVDLVIQIDRIGESPSPWESKLAELEGTNGPIQLFFAARRKIQTVEKSLEAEEVPSRELLSGLLGTLDEGKSLMSKVISARPNWAQGYEQLGLLHELAANLNLQIAQNRAAAQIEKQEAISHYRRALDAGGRNLSLIYRLVNLDTDAQRIKQVFELLDSRTVSLSTGLAARQTDLAWQLNDEATAEKVANKLVETQPDDPLSWLIWGQVQAKLDRLEKANQAAETAREKIPKNADQKDILLRIFQFYVATSLWQGNEDLRRQQLDRASAMIEQLTALEKPESRILLKAKLLAFVGDPEATSNFLEAEKQNPNEAMLSDILDHYLGSIASIESLGHAIRITEMLVQKNPLKKDYKLQLASLLMRRGLGVDFDDARKLLQESADPGSIEYFRAEAIRLVQIQSMLPKNERLDALAEAERLMQNVTANSGSNEDRFLLAEVYLARSKLLEPDSDEQIQTLEKSEKIIADLDKSDSLSPNQVANLANYFMSGRKDYARSQSNLDRLKVMTQTASPPFSAPYQLQVRLWKAQGIPNLIDKTSSFALEFENQIDAGGLVLTIDQKSQLFVEMALIFQEADDADRALEWLRKAVALNSGHAQKLILTLSQNNQKVEAVNIAKAFYEKKPNTELIQAVVSALGSGQASAEAFAAAQPMLDDVVQKHSDDQNLLMSVGDYYAFQPEMAEKAILYYKKALELGEQEPLRTLSLLNNLATVLGEGDSAMRLEALRLIARAESMVTKLPLALSDTKAVVLMNNGDVEQARQILRSLVAADKDPRFWFHLAEAEWKFAATSGIGSDQRFFQTAMNTAIEGGVENTALTPGELGRWLKMKENLNSISEVGTSE